jgi:hypothetical protein
MPISNIKNDTNEMQMHEKLRGSCLRASQLKTQFEESDRLEMEIKKNLAGLGYEF